MGKIDIFNSAKRYEKAVEWLGRSEVSEENKELILSFAGDCLIGWGGRKLTKIRMTKYVFLLKVLAEQLGKSFHYIDSEDVKRLLLAVDSDPSKGEWSQYDYRVTIRKFVSWLREEHGYPGDYPNAEHLSKILPLLKYPEEVKKIRIRTPNKKKPRDEIPVQAEMRYLREASINLRDKAYFAVVEELGPRIGGIGSRQVKHVEFDDLGARVAMEDKTMKGEGVRLITSASYLRDWLESHPFKENKEAPLWVNLSRLPYCEPLDYEGFRRMIQRTVERHNTKAEKNGLPRITRRIHPHGFRYFAQKFELNGGEEKEKNITCPRCRDVNFPKSLYCRRCGLPLNDKAKKYDETIDDLIAKILLDPELSQRLREKLLEVKVGGEE